MFIDVWVLFRDAHGFFWALRAAEQSKLSDLMTSIPLCQCVRFFTGLDHELMLIRVISLCILDGHLVMLQQLLSNSGHGSLQTLGPPTVFFALHPTILTRVA